MSKQQNQGTDDTSGDDDAVDQNDQTVDMDDTTGSDGGLTEDQSDDSNESRSDTSRVEGMGISGGTGDDDSAQSGGRSQY